VRLEPRVALEVNGVDLTSRQLEVIYAIYRNGSQRSAARSLGITTPVLNRYMRQIEAKTRLKLADSTPNGTVLTADGEKIAREFAALGARMAKSDSPVSGALSSPRTYCSHHSPKWTPRVSSTSSYPMT